VPKQGQLKGRWLYVFAINGRSRFDRIYADLRRLSPAFTSAVRLGVFIRICTCIWVITGQ
jgi:hypothetical protein